MPRCWRIKVWLEREGGGVAPTESAAVTYSQARAAVRAHKRDGRRAELLELERPHVAGCASENTGPGWRGLADCNCERRGRAGRHTGRRVDARQGELFK